MARGGKARKRPRGEGEGEEAEPLDPEGELEGFVHADTLFLRDQSGIVYSSERDLRGALVKVGRWDAATASIVRAPKAAKRAQAAPAPSEPHPKPKPLNFAAAEEDHCETAPEAYEHIVGLLQLLARRMAIQPGALRIYDPYFCNGAVVRHLAALGFPNVYNKNEDFYAMQASGQLPEFDVIVTNPPYTHPHPQKLLEFCASSKKPWLALMPNWVCSRDYFHSSLGISARQPTPTKSTPFFIAPRKRYHYWTPRGRRMDIVGGGAKAKTHGHTNAALGVRTSPFVSFWYCGEIAAKTRKQLSPPDGCVICWSIETLPPGVRDR